MKLHEIIKKKIELSKSHAKSMDEHRRMIDDFNLQMEELGRLEDAAMNGLNIDYIQIAESVMYVQGDPDAVTDDGSKYVISRAAINDIASNDCGHLKIKYFGNKVYSGFYQRTDCRYGYGPSHGGIKDEIGLKDEARNRDLTDEEKDACIYYLKNYSKIKKLQNS